MTGLTTVAPPATTATTAEPTLRRSRADRINWPMTLFIGLCALTVLIPLYVAVSVALHSPADIARGEALSPPTVPYLQNFVDAWNITDYPAALLNTAVIAVTSVVLTLLTNSLVAYAIARNLHRRAYRGVYLYFLSAIFVPFPIIMLPLVKQTSMIGLSNPAGVIVLHVVFGFSFNTFLYVAYLRSIPESLEESARIDGATTWQIFWRIVFPLLAPMNATIGILAFLAAWNDFLLPLVIISNPDLQTLPVVNYLFQGQFNINYGPAFASYVMTMTPVLIVYLVSQRWVLAGVTRGAVK